MRNLADTYESTNEIILDFFKLYCLFADSEPLTFNEAMQDKRWKEAIDEEIKSIEKNNTWKLTSLPKAKNPVELNGYIR